MRSLILGSARRREVVEYESTTLGLRRMLRVHTPPGYTPARKYPVLYLQHGLGNTSTEWTQRARAPIMIDNLLADKKSSSRSSSSSRAEMRPRRWPTRSRAIARNRLMELPIMRTC
ncbi:MAG TPA: alpha/beta hydrolase-fold protein [Vicinamibacterales bacterium]|nr:alpha/beta hydrolase-fold protein [Vicinamibacterales bacterium]